MRRYEVSPVDRTLDPDHSGFMQGTELHRLDTKGRNQEFVYTWKPSVLVVGAVDPVGSGCNTHERRDDQ